MHWKSSKFWKIKKFKIMFRKYSIFATYTQCWHLQYQTTFLSIRTEFQINSLSEKMKRCLSRSYTNSLRLSGGENSLHITTCKGTELQCSYVICGIIIEFFRYVSLQKCSHWNFSSGFLLRLMQPFLPPPFQLKLVLVHCWLTVSS